MILTKLLLVAQLTSSRMQTMFGVQSIVRNMMPSNLNPLVQMNDQVVQLGPPVFCDIYEWSAWCYFLWEYGGTVCRWLLKPQELSNVHTIMNHFRKISIIWPPGLKKIKGALVQRNVSYYRSLLNDLQSLLLYYRMVLSLKVLPSSLIENY